jgi:hypothetical protein
MASLRPHWFQRASQNKRLTVNAEASSRQELANWITSTTGVIDRANHIAALTINPSPIDVESGPYCHLEDLAQKDRPANPGLAGTFGGHMATRQF